MEIFQRGNMSFIFFYYLAIFFNLYNFYRNLEIIYINIHYFSASIFLLWYIYIYIYKYVYNEIFLSYFSPIAIAFWYYNFYGNYFSTRTYIKVLYVLDISNKSIYILYIILWYRYPKVFINFNAYIYLYYFRILLFLICIYTYMRVRACTHLYTHTSYL